MKVLQHFWQRGVFGFVIIGSALFVVLTVLAMFFYPGGSMIDPATKGYSFFGNFFSELGFLRTKSGADNTISASLFILALTLAGFGLVLFFMAFPRFFHSTRAGRFLSLVGSLAGGLAGLAFIGVAVTPGDVNLDLHKEFVLWAFRLFPLAVFSYTAAIFLNTNYPRIYAWIFAAFCLLLVIYMLLLEFGPNPAESLTGLIIQACGQKIIAYASLGSIMFQSIGALNVNSDDLLKS